jgi:hypothetical protein
MKYGLIIVFTFFIIESKAQFFSAKRNKLFNYVLSSNIGNQTILFQNPTSLLLEFERKNERFHRTLFKIGKTIYLTTEGYGEVYKLKSVNDSLLIFQRVDSTIFSGNNFNASFFYYGNKIYSFGGYGYWRFNGQLRLFNEGHEWDIIKLNQEIQYNTKISIFDSATSTLYFISKPYFDESFENHKEHTTINKLDLLKNEVEELGRLKPVFENSILESPGFVICYNPFGILLLHQNKWVLLNLKENKVFEYSNKEVTSKLFGNSYFSPTIYHSIQDSILIYSKQEDSLLKFQLLEKDFINTKKEFFVKKTIGGYLNILFLFPLLIPIFLIYRRKKITQRLIDKQKNSLSENHESILLNADGVYSLLEQDLIDMVYTLSQSKTLVTVEHVNKLLGLSKKNIEVQKRTRREIINSINYKFKKNSQLETDLVQAVRSDEDKRYMNYYISDSNWTLYKEGRK